MQEVDLSGDGGVLKSVLRQGAGDTPPKGYEVHAYYTGILEDGSKFETKYNSRDGQLYKFTLGEGRVIKGWDVGFASMRKGERAMLTCRSDYAFGENGSPPTIPSGATLKFDIELIDFQEVSKEIWEMTETEKTTQAVVCKEHGTQCFKQKDFAAALDKYEAAIKFSQGGKGEWDDSSEEEDEKGIEANIASKKSEALVLSCSLNAALCALKLKDVTACIRHASKALELDPQNIKGLYRRGTAYLEKDLKKAKQDLMLAKQLDPENKDVIRGLQLLKKKREAERAKEKAAFGGCLSK